MAQKMTSSKPVKFAKKALISTGVVALGFTAINTLRNRGPQFVRQPIDFVRNAMINGL